MRCVVGTGELGNGNRAGKLQFGMIGEVHDDGMSENFPTVKKGKTVKANGAGARCREGCREVVGVVGGLGVPTLLRCPVSRVPTSNFQQPQAFTGT